MSSRVELLEALEYVCALPSRSVDKAVPDAD